MIEITQNKTLRLVPSARSKIPELEQPLQFGYICPYCEQVIHGAIKMNGDSFDRFALNRYATPTQNHAYPLSYSTHIVSLVTGERSQLFWETGHFIEGYDEYGHHNYKARCKYTHGWHYPSSAVIAKQVFETLLSNFRICLHSTLISNFREAIQQHPSISLPFLEGLSNTACIVPLLQKVTDECNQAAPVYLLASSQASSESLTQIVTACLEQVPSF